MARMIDADRLADGLKLHRQPTGQKHEADRQWAVGYNAGLDRALHSIAYAPTLTQPNEPLVTGFDVVDTKTGEYPDLEKIALKEDWAKHLMYCDMEGFAIEEDGTLLLLDECGRQACCPVGRFEIRRPPEGEGET